MWIISSRCKVNQISVFMCILNVWRGNLHAAQCIRHVYEKCHEVDRQYERLLLPVVFYCCMLIRFHRFAVCTIHTRIYVCRFLFEKNTHIHTQNSNNSNNNGVQSKQKWIQSIDRLSATHLPHVLNAFLSIFFFCAGWLFNLRAFKWSTVTIGLDWHIQAILAVRKATWSCFLSLSVDAKCIKTTFFYSLCMADRLTEYPTLGKHEIVVVNRKLP